MNFFAIWTFLTTHWNDFMQGVTSTKLIADTVASIKSVLPDRIDSKETAQKYLETSVELLNDKNVSIEDKEWELNTRQELVKSMVHVTALEVGYQIARGGIMLIFFTITMHYWAKFFIRRKKS